MFAAWLAPLCVAPLALAQAPSPLSAAAVPTKAPCPTPEESRRIGELYAKSPAPMTFAAAPQLKLAEVVVAGGLPRSLGTGVDGAHFREIWASLTAWPSAMLLVMKGGSVSAVFLAEGADPTAEQLAKFEKTWRLLRSLPQHCAASGLDKP